MASAAAGDSTVPGTTQTDQLNAQLLKAYKGALDAGTGPGLSLAGRGVPPDEDDTQSNSTGGWGDEASGSESGGAREEPQEAQDATAGATAAVISEIIERNASTGSSNGRVDGAGGTEQANAHGVGSPSRGGGHRNKGKGKGKGKGKSRGKGKSPGRRR